MVSTPFGRGHKQDIAGRVVARTSGRHISKARLPQLCCVVLCFVISGVDRSGTQIIHGKHWKTVNAVLHHRQRTCIFAQLRTYNVGHLLSGGSAQMETHKSSFFLLLPEEIPRRPHPHFVLGKRLANRLCDWACVRVLSVMVSVIGDVRVVFHYYKQTLLNHNIKTTGRCSE